MNRHAIQNSVGGNITQPRRREEHRYRVQQGHNSERSPSWEATWFQPHASAEQEKNRRIRRGPGFVAVSTLTQ